LDEKILKGHFNDRFDETSHKIIADKLPAIIGLWYNRIYRVEIMGECK